ncbi:DotD/TraH family lipoprotein [Martelella mediterranea]|uniref:DotD/TraH family lipoprotein n=1 Tax=Martelella mediterranea TaxID=293089 RepID=UPI001E62518B|nr:DotD/TraH family lipoprotein [Martelella mediterranea]MCD1635874.1 DotD/TraH family lipoprotein [Martelella mediterranea]
MRIAISLALAVLAGCTSTRDAPSDSPTINYIDNQVHLVRSALNDAALYQNVLEARATNTVEVRNPGIAQGPLMKIVDAEWQGTLDELTTRVASEVDYSVSASGEKAGAPILISTNFYNLTALGLLREAYGQAKGRARLVIDQGARHMTIYYARPEQSPIPHQEDLKP